MLLKWDAQPPLHVYKTAADIHPKKNRSCNFALPHPPTHPLRHLETPGISWGPAIRPALRDSPPSPPTFELVRREYPSLILLMQVSIDIAMVATTPAPLA